MIITVIIVLAINMLVEIPPGSRLIILLDPGAWISGIVNSLMFVVIYIIVHTIVRCYVEEPPTANDVAF